MQQVNRIDPVEGVSKTFVDIPDITAGALEKARIEAQNKKAKERMAADTARLEKWSKDQTRVKSFNKHHTMGESRLIPIEFFVTFPKAKKSALLSTNALGLSASQETEFMMYSIIKDLRDGKLYSVSDYLSDFAPNPAHEDWIHKTNEKPRLKEFLPEPPSDVFMCDSIFYNNRFQINPLKLDASPQAYYSFFVPGSTILTEYKI